MCLCVRPYGKIPGARGEREGISEDIPEPDCHTALPGTPPEPCTKQDMAKLLVDEVSGESVASVPDLMTDNHGLTYIAIRNCELERFSAK